MIVTTVQIFKNYEDFTEICGHSALGGGDFKQKKGSQDEET
jgi:hypothetical protein